MSSAPFRLARPAFLVAVLLGAFALREAKTSEGAPSVAPTSVLFVSDRSGAEAIYRTDTRGAPATLVVDGEQPAWCGRNLAFVRAGDIFIAHVDGTIQTRVTDSAATEANPTCSPDGTRVAFSRSDAAGGTDVYSIDVTNHREARLTTSGANSEPAWSLDGRRIAFVASGHVMVMNPDGAGVRTLTRSSAVDANPTWLGDSKVLFDGTALAGGDSHLWMTGIGAGPGIALTGEPGDQRHPSFISLSLPEPIVFQERDGGHDYRIYAMSYDGSRVKQLTAGPGADTEPVAEPPACACANVQASLGASATSSRIDGTIAYVWQYVGHSDAQAGARLRGTVRGGFR